MASICISNCIEDCRVPVRATYINVYKWPESDAEFIKSIKSNMQCASPGAPAHPRVVDSISCRQLYLRSYSFSRKESVPEKTKKCLGKVRRRVAYGNKKVKAKSSTIDQVKRRRGLGGALVFMRAKQGSLNAMLSFFRGLLYCTAKVDVVDHGYM